jgi:hypothetical protein
MALRRILFYRFKLLQIYSFNQKNIYFKLVALFLCKNLTKNVSLIVVRDNYLNLKIYTIEEYCKLRILYEALSYELLLLEGVPCCGQLECTLISVFLLLSRMFCHNVFMSTKNT